MAMAVVGDAVVWQIEWKHETMADEFCQKWENQIHAMNSYSAPHDDRRPPSRDGNLT